MKYLIVIEKTKTGFCAYLPDVDGCIATGRTRREVVKSMQEALEFHFEGMAMDGERAPKPTSSSAYVEVTPPKIKPNPVRRGFEIPTNVRGSIAGRYAQRRNGESAHARKRP